MPAWLVYQLIQALRLIAIILDSIVIKPVYWILRKCGLV